MDKEYVMYIAKTIMEQIKAAVPEGFLCWNLQGGFLATVYKEMAALAFDVNARLFKGRVIVAYDGGLDTYELWLRDMDGNEKCVGTDIYCDQIGEFIDTAVEVGNDPEEYRKFLDERANEWKKAALSSLN